MFFGSRIAKEKIVYTYDHAPRIIFDLKVSSFARDIFIYIYKIFNIKERCKSDNRGLYVNVSRKELAQKVGISIKTVIKYVRELCRCGLIYDLRMGVKEMNRIYLCEVEDKYIIHDTNVNDKEKYSDTVVGQAKDILQEEVAEHQIKQILDACNGNISELKEAVKYNKNKKIKSSYVGMIIDTLKNGYHKTTTLSIGEVREKNVSSKHVERKKKSDIKQNRFTNIYTHDYDLDVLQQLEMLRNDLLVGNITEEEYREKVRELEIFSR